MLDLLLALFCLGVWLVHAWDILSIRHVKDLSAIPTVTETRRMPPSLSIVIAARNEEKTLPQALQSVLNIEYEGLQVIVVNDRSEDSTGAILNAFAARHPNLEVVHIDTLPPGWLGKINAMHLGAHQVTTKWMLFTDADIHFNHSTLLKAVNLAEHSKVDHLAVLPQMEEHNALLGMVLATTLTIFMMFMRPWKIRDSVSHYAGIGAFNMIKTESYLAYGGHSKIKMRPDDDMMLGKLVKVSGGSSEYAFSGGLIRFSWYESLGELINGLSKNMYASLEYSLTITMIAAVMHLLMFVWPAAALLIYDPDDDWFIVCLYVMALGLSWCISLSISVRVGATRRYVLGTPIGALIVVYILIRTAVMTHYNGGIIWRGTVYPLEELRRNVI